MNHIFALFLAVSARAAEPSELVFRSGTEQTALLELFSSEGCSSCPPADERVRSWAAGPGLWKDFVPAVFHVDYWDHLGWIDPFTDRWNSERQRDYAKFWGGRLYTPCFVLNGREWQPSDGSEPRVSGVTGILEIRSPAGIRSAGLSRQHRVRYIPAKGQKGPWTVEIVLLGFGLSSPVRMGENAGKTLLHDAVVLSHRGVALKAGEGKIELSARTGVSRALYDYPARQRSSFTPKPKRLAVAAWVSESRGWTVRDGVTVYAPNEQPHILQAVGGFLN